jgi:hypothetical protein
MERFFKSFSLFSLCLTIYAFTACACRELLVYRKVLQQQNPPALLSHLKKRRGPLKRVNTTSLFSFSVLSVFTKLALNYVTMNCLPSIWCTVCFVMV